VANVADPGYHCYLGLVLNGLGPHVAAEARLREAVRLKPDLPAAYSHLGAALFALGRASEAEGSYGQALRLRPNDSEALNNLLRALGRPADAEAPLREAARLAPDFADAHRNLGEALCDLDRPAAAESSLRQAARLRPHDVGIRNKLGAAMARLGRFADAQACFRDALRLDPSDAAALYNLGLSLLDDRRPAEAEEAFRRALDRRPQDRDTLNGLGVALAALGRPSEAETALRDALAVSPGYAPAQCNLAGVLCELGRHGEAEAIAREALRRQPDSVDALVNLGVALLNLGRFAESAASQRAALGLNPSHASAHRNLASTLLAGDRFEEAWEHLEWRWALEHLEPDANRFAVPLWRGEPAAGRTLLLHAEQGMGDTLQFCRYAAMVEARATVVLEVQRPLVRLMSSLDGVDKVVARGDPLPAFDLRCPLLSLPGAFGTSLDSVPAATPYLAADPAQVTQWRERLTRLGGLKVGLVWAGEARRDRPQLAAVDARRSVTLANLAPLGEVAGVSFVSLQKGEPAAQAGDPPPGLTLHDFTSELNDFADTAALVDALDLVISVDTSAAHLAGALGKPVWLLNRYDTDWRWLLDRDDSPWYPTLRQFRQPSLGDWASVIGEAREALQRLAAGDQKQLRPRAAWTQAA